MVLFFAYSIMTKPNLLVTTDADGDITVIVFPGDPQLVAEIHIPQAEGSKVITEDDVHLDLTTGTLTITDEAGEVIEAHDLSFLLP